MRSLAFVLAVAAGCIAETSIIRRGVIAPPRPAGCSVTFMNLPQDQAAELYDMVGYVARRTTEAPSWDGRTRELLWPRVCELGGSIVTPWISDGAAISFIVWRERSPATNQDRPTAATSGRRE